MSILLHTDTILDIDINKLVRLEIGNFISEQRSYSQSDLKLCIQMSNFTLIAKSIESNKNNLKFIGTFTHLNGRNLIIPSAYEEMFIKLASLHGQNIQLFVQGNRKQLFLRYYISFPQTTPNEQKLEACLKALQSVLFSFQNALQIIGLGAHNNKYSLQIKKALLKIKNNMMKSIRKNQIKREIQSMGQIGKENCSVVNIKQVIENPEDGMQQKTMKKGGYFQVAKRNSIIIKESGEKEQKILAWKTPLNNKNNCQQKIKKQIELVQKVVNNKYLLTYYFSKNSPSSVYMDYVPGLLKDFIYKRHISLGKLINLAMQLVQAVSILHKSKIVHRDLKPDNVLVDGETIKIIDYAESILMDQLFLEKHSLGSTVPYSPFECILGKQQGFNKSEIDLWSIPIMLYEMAFKSLPLFYSRWIGGDILEKWRTANDFSIFPIHRRRKGLRYVQQVLSLITIRGIQVKPEERLSLETYFQLIAQLKQFHKEIVQIL